MSRFRQFLTGKTRLGQIVYGIVDALPVPNLLNPLRATLDRTPNARISELASVTWGKIDKIRLAIGVLVSWLILSGRATPETIDRLLDVLLRIF